MAQITERDSRLLAAIGTFGMLTTRHIGELFFPNARKTTLCRRLRALEKEGAIRRIPGLTDGRLLWSLTPKSADRLGIEGIVRRVNRNSLEHDVLLLNLRIMLTRAGIVDTWVPEHELRHKAWKEKYERRIEIEPIPDALVTVNARGNFQAIALELEQRKKTASRYRRIFQNYRAKNSLWAVWYLVPNTKTGERLESLWTKEAIYSSSSPHFMWSVIDDVLHNQGNSRLYNERKSCLLTEALTP